MYLILKNNVMQFVNYGSNGTTIVAEIITIHLFCASSLYL